MSNDFLSAVVKAFKRLISELSTRIDGHDTRLSTHQIAIEDMQVQKQNVLTFDTAPTANSDNPVKSGGIYSAIGTARSDAISMALSEVDNFANYANNVYETKNDAEDALALKQDVLTFDSAPTPGSDNPVKSDGIKTALDGKVDKVNGAGLAQILSCDVAQWGKPTEFKYNVINVKRDNGTTDSVNVYPVVKMDTLLGGKQDVLTFDTEPTANSDNPVKSGGVKTALDGKADKVNGAGLVEITQIVDLWNGDRYGIDQVGEDGTVISGGAFYDVNVINSKLLNKSDKMRIVTESGEVSDNSATLVLDLEEYNGAIIHYRNASAELSKIHFNVDTPADDFICVLNFATGNTVPYVSYGPHTGIQAITWSGTDCTYNNGVSVFQPLANKQYDIRFYYTGLCFVGLVTGYYAAFANRISTSVTGTPPLTLGNSAGSLAGMEIEGASGGVGEVSGNGYKIPVTVSGEQLFTGADIVSGNNNAGFDVTSANYVNSISGQSVNVSLPAWKGIASPMISKADFKYFAVRSDQNSGGNYTIIIQGYDENGTKTTNDTRVSAAVAGTLYTITAESIWGLNVYKNSAKFRVCVLSRGTAISNMNVEFYGNSQEAYHAPVTTDIHIGNTALESGDKIKIKASPKSVLRIDSGTEQTDITSLNPDIPELFEGTVVVDVDTTVTPSGMTVEYYEKEA